MFNLLQCIIEDVAATNSLDNDPIVMSTLDINNAFNTLQRQHMNDQRAAGPGCPINLDSLTQAGIANNGMVGTCCGQSSRHIMEQKES